MIWSIFYVLFSVSLLLIQGFFSGSEIAIVAAEHKKLRLLADDGSKGARLALKLLKQPEWYFSTTLLGTNFSVIANTVLITGIMLHSLGKKGELLTVFLLPPILVILGEIVPKTVFQYYATRLAPRVSPIIWVISYLLYPLVFVISKFTRMTLKLMGAGETLESPFFTREELKMLLRLDETELELEKGKKTMIQKILSFRDIRVKEVMKPLVDVAGIPEDCQLVRALEVFQKTKHSRLPVFKGRIDNIVGLVNAFDLIGLADTKDNIKSFVREAHFVPETKYVDQLLVEFQRKRIHMAVVVDEYGGATGIVTFEDLLEEIVGEIEDEFYIEKPYYVRIAEERYLISARMEIDALRETLHIRLPKDDYETVGGFILEQLGYIPKEGETVRYKNITFTVKRASERDIKEVEMLIGPETGRQYSGQ